MLLLKAYAEGERWQVGLLMSAWPRAAGEPEAARPALEAALGRLAAALA